MALLDQLAQGNPIAGLLAQRRQQGGVPQQPPRFQSVGEMVPQANLQSIGPQEGPGGGLMPLPDGATQQASGQAAPSPRSSGTLLPVRSGGGSGDGGDGVRGLLGSLLTGEDDPRLGEEDNKNAVIEGLKTAGMVGLGALAAGAAPIALPLIGAIAGRGAADDARNEALEISREQQALRSQQEAQEIISQGQLLDPNSRLQIVGELIRGGHTAAAEKLLELDEQMSKAQAGADVDIARDVFTQELNDLEDRNPENLLDIAGRMAAQGFNTEANALRETASALEDIRQTRGEIEWIEASGGDTIGVDVNGEEVARFDAEMTPYEQAQIARDYAEMERLKVEGASEDYLKNLKELRTEFRGEASDYMESANLSNAALNAADDGVGDLMMINSLAKLVDPAGRITDSDVRVYVESAGWTDRQLQNWRNLVGNKNRLPENLRKSLKRQIQGLREVMANSYRQNLIDPYRISAGRAGVNPNDFIINPFSNEREEYTPLGNQENLPPNLDPTQGGGSVDDFFSGFGGGGG